MSSHSCTWNQPELRMCTCARHQASCPRSSSAAVLVIRGHAVRAPLPGRHEPRRRRSGVGICARARRCRRGRRLGLRVAPLARHAALNDGRGQAAQRLQRASALVSCSSPPHHTQAAAATSRDRDFYVPVWTRASQNVTEAPAWLRSPPASLHKPICISCKSKQAHALHSAVPAPSLTPALHPPPRARAP